MTRRDETTLVLADLYATACTMVRLAKQDLTNINKPITSGEYQEAALRIERSERNAMAARKALLWHAGGES